MHDKSGVLPDVHFYKVKKETIIKNTSYKILDYMCTIVVRLRLKGPFGSLHFGGIEIYIMN